MNIALGSMIEALAIDYLNVDFLTAVNNIWTWVVVLTGAVGFLIRIRKSPIFIPWPISLGPEVMGLVPEAEALAHALAQTPRVAPEGSDWTTRKKFTVYYKDDDMEIVGQELNKVNELILNKTMGAWERKGVKDEDFERGRDGMVPLPGLNDV